MLEKASYDEKMPSPKSKENLTENTGTIKNNEVFNQ